MNKNLHYVIAALCGIGLILATAMYGQFLSGGKPDRFSQFELALVVVGAYLVSKLLLIERKSDGAPEEKKAED